MAKLQDLTTSQRPVVKPAAAKPRTQTQCSLAQLETALNQVMQPQRFKDYCPNGLQVEGKGDIAKLLCGVTASLAFIEEAIAQRADAVLVHHGYFFKGESPQIVGQKKRRIAALLAANISLFAYHLPLDAHPTLGNNAQLGRELGWQVAGVFGDAGHGASLGVYSDFVTPITAEGLEQLIAKRLGRTPLVVGSVGKPIRRVAWCTGAAQDMLQEAIDCGADAFISGEISERTTHLAREMGVVYIAAGHHATERYGVQALGKSVAVDLGIECAFFDDNNPV
jgi:dinuclear metal center YbgI/SA1388 family protein